MANPKIPPVKKSPTFFGKKTKKFIEEQDVRKKKEKLKKFPAMALSGRPLPENRHGGITPKEKKIINLLLEDQPQDISAEQVEQLSKLLRRNPQTIKALIINARDSFANNARLYVEVHAKSVQAAYINGEFDIAARHAEWAMENVSSEGESIIEAASRKQADNSPKVLINIPLGGITPTVE